MSSRSALVSAALGAVPRPRRLLTDTPGVSVPAGPRGVKPLVIGHRGACGYRPEHTREAYRLAAGQGAVSIEPDLVMSSDGVLVARHENELSRSTDVADHPEFAGRCTTRVVEGRTVTGWFTEDFTAAELKRLGVRERHPKIRPTNTWWDGKGPGILTLDEVLDLAEDLAIDVHAEIKHAHHFARQGLDPAAALMSTLAARPARVPAVTAMAFEPTVLHDLRARGWSRPLVQLVDRKGRTVGAEESAVRYREMVTREGLDRIADYADAIGVHKDLVLPRTEDDTVQGPSKVVKRAHRRGLEVLAWTVRAENKYLPAQARVNAAPQEYGDLGFEVSALAAAGVDGILTDHPDLVVACLARV